MPVIIYEKTLNGLYPTGQRTVSTFPSGLVRVDQTFVCKTSAAGTHRTALVVGANFPNGSSPAIDGLKIFPEPQEKQRDDGFTEFIVSAYGRTSTSSTITESYNSSTVFLLFYRKIQTKKSIELKYVIQASEPIIRNPQISSSITVKEVDWSRSLNLQTSNGTLINQTVNIPSVYGSNQWASFTFSFVGSGSVAFGGTYVGTLNGTGVDDVTTGTFVRINNNVGLTITVTGDVRDASIKQYASEPPTQTIQSVWVLTSTNVINYGTYREVSVNYESR